MRRIEWIMVALPLVAFSLLACESKDPGAGAGGEGGEGGEDQGAATGGPGHKALWSKSFGGEKGAQLGRLTAVDASGAVLAFGEYSYDSSVDFGGGPVEPSGLGADSFLAKLDTKGAHVFSKSVPLSKTDSYFWTFAEMSPQGEVFVFGDIASAAPLGGPAVPTRLFKLDAAGAFLWSWDYTSKPFVGNLGVAAIRAASSGDLFLVSSYSLAPDLGTGPLPEGPGLLVAKLDAGGNPIWVTPFPASYLIYPRAIDVGPGDELVFTGSMVGTVDFGAGPVGSMSSVDTFLVKVDASGKVVWSKLLSAMTDPKVESDVTKLAVSPSGDIALGGQGGSDVNETGAVITVLDGSGTYRWSKLLKGESSGSELNGLDATPDGGFMLCARFDGTIELGGWPFHGPNLLYVELSKDGDHVWSDDYGDQSSYNGCSLAVDSAGDVATVGFFSNKIAFDNTVLKSTFGVDVFVAKLPR